MAPMLPSWTPSVDPADLEHILNHTAGLWEELREQRLFITGGTGFFGHWILESLLWANDRLDLNVQVTLLSRRPQTFEKKYPQLYRHPALSWVKGDVKSFEFPGEKFSYLIHAASEGDCRLAQENPLLVYETIVDGTRRVLEFARICGAKKMLFTSSGAVYGKQPPELTHIPEDYPGAPDPLDPRSAYSEGKRTAELLCSLYTGLYGFEAKIARCFAFIGPHLPLDANFAAGNFIRDALQGGPIVIQGDGTPYRSYLYAADLAIWLWTILFKGKSCRAYNVGSEQALSIRELAEVIGRIVNPAIVIRILQERIPETLSSRYVPLCQRSSNELGLKDYTELDTSVQKTVRWNSLP